VFFDLGDAMALPGPPAFTPRALRRAVTELQRPDRRVGADLVRPSRRSHSVACITVSRTSPEDVGFREVFLLVDGQEVAMLSHGESITHELPAGPHRVRAHNTLFWKTHDVVLQPGQHVRFRAVNRAGWGTFGLLMILGAAPLYLTFDRDKDG
jgi:hypothetical protein